ncbi:MAG: hypothetical protein AAFP08_02155, partial [Bacteroidota bacterium]
LLVFSCKEEDNRPLDFDAINTDIYVELEINDSLYSRPLSWRLGEQLSFYESSNQYYKGYSRNGMSSAVGFLGTHWADDSQDERPCYEIEPLMFDPPNFLSDPFHWLGPTLFVEFVGLESSRSDCRLDSASLAEHLQVGFYALGQQPDQAHIHLYSHDLPLVNGEEANASDFYLSTGEENDGLFLEITDVDWESQRFTDTRGVYVTFEIPLAKGYGSYDGRKYFITNLKGRLLFPFQ